MKTLYVDMDGTLAEWRLDKCEKDTYEEGYFFELKPYSHVLAAIREIIELYPDVVRIKILSAVHTDNPYAIPDKNRWLDKYLPEVQTESRIFIPCGENKADYCGKLSEDDYLLDDYVKNLSNWKYSGGTPIKLYNGVNAAYSSLYPVIDKDAPAEAIVVNILSIIDVFSQPLSFAA